MIEELRSLEDLLDLQVVDLEIDRLFNERQSLPELDEYRTADAQAREIAGAREVAEKILRETTLEVDRMSGELELAEEKLAAEQNRLYAGGLSARDATFLRQEVEMLARQNGEKEQTTLELMETRENQEVGAAELTEQLRSANDEKDRLESIIEKAWNGIDARVADKEVRKGDIVPLIPEDLLDLYEELRILKEGVAIGRLVEGVCAGCHLQLTAAEQLDLKRSDPPRCQHCRRILVP